MCCAVIVEVGSSSVPPMMIIIIIDLRIALSDRVQIIVWSITLCHVSMCVGAQPDKKKILEHYVVLEG